VLQNWCLGCNARNRYAKAKKVCLWLQTHTRRKLAGQQFTLLQAVAMMKEEQAHLHTQRHKDIEKARLLQIQIQQQRQASISFSSSFTASDEFKASEGGGGGVAEEGGSWELVHGFRHTHTKGDLPFVRKLMCFNVHR